MSNEVRRCCTNESLYIVFYKTNTVYLVCSKHCKELQYQIGISKIFDYTTKKELQLTGEIFND